MKDELVIEKARFFDEYVMPIMRIINDNLLFDDDITWITYDDKVLAWIDCSGVFELSNPDQELIREEDISTFSDAVDDCIGADSRFGFMYAKNLFIARKRKKRPIMYPQHRSLWSLFDSCGPERDTRMVGEELGGSQ